ncbi:hypothetical protein J2J97_32055 (plasmid) [Rhizobium bangladeshense]|uniref:hypothetical protein n=1 Tax=Rhizobium bangladeshense TaxID=1138189 RepID=UPI001A97DF62|nr:hypothetical protein [Rhizobium bangladeshense]QSY98541.1 hypothetical protein J2J97_32055 [Rhizobium bangladeshense]
MTNTNDDYPRIRRRTRLPIRGMPPGSASVVQLPEAMRPAPHDEIDREIDEALRAGRRIDMSRAFPEPPPAAPGENLRAHQPVPGVDAPDVDLDQIPSITDERMSPAQRLRHVATLSPTYLDEYKSRLVHRLLMRRLPLDTIAAQLGCSVRMVQVIKTKLNKRARRQAMMLDVYDVAAESLRFYNEVRGLALRQADSNANHIKDRQAALRIALEAENDKVRFLSASGYFEHMPFKPDQTKLVDPEQEKVDTTLSMMAAIVSGDTSIEDIDSFFESDELGAEDGTDFDGLDPSTDLL